MRIVYTQSEGFTFIELLISLALSMILSTGLLHLIGFAQKIYWQQHVLAQRQESAHLVNFYLAQAVRQAGSLECSNFQQIRVKHIPSQLDAAYYGLAQAWPLKILSASQLSPQYRNIAQRIAQDSDILWVKHLTDVYPVQNNFPWAVQLSGLVEFQPGTILALFDCEAIDFFQLEQPSKLNHSAQTTLLSLPTQRWSKRYQQAWVAKFASVMFYMGNNQRTNALGRPQFSLFETDLNGHSLELVAGIEALNLYAINADKVGSEELPLGVVADFTLATNSTGLPSKAPLPWRYAQWSSTWAIRGRSAICDH
jgi:hypothetical protein